MTASPLHISFAGWLEDNCMFSSDADFHAISLAWQLWEQVTQAGLSVLTVHLAARVSPHGGTHIARSPDPGCFKAHGVLLGAAVNARHLSISSHFSFSLVQALLAVSSLSKTPAGCQKMLEVLKQFINQSLLEGQPCSS